MAGNRTRMIGVRFAAASCAALMLAQSALAQGLQKAPAGAPLQRNLPPVLMGPRQPPAPTLAEPRPPPVEKVEADVSTRSVEVTTGFTGHEILVFGAIDHSQQPDDATDNYYDVVVVVEGTPYPVVVRRKSDVAGVWINTSSVLFASVPSFYAIASTRPIDQIAGPGVLEVNSIGFAHIKMTPSPGIRWKLSEYELAGFKAAVIRLKQKEHLYIVESKDGVTFTGRSLFRSTISLPGNVPVGPLVARTYLFRNGEVLSAHIARVRLERKGIERVLHDFAFRDPFAYGVIAVMLAVIAGLAGSMMFRRETA